MMFFHAGSSAKIIVMMCKKKKEKFSLEFYYWRVHKNVELLIIRVQQYWIAIKKFRNRLISWMMLACALIISFSATLRSWMRAFYYSPLRRGFFVLYGVFLLAPAELQLVKLMRFFFAICSDVRTKALQAIDQFLQISKQYHDKVCCSSCCAIFSIYCEFLWETLQIIFLSTPN